MSKYKKSMWATRLAIAGATLTLAGSSLAFASKEDGTGVRGGGHVVEVGGKLELLDTLQGASCEWVSGQKLLAKTQYLQDLLKKVRILDWYLALELKREISYIEWCFTGKLYNVDPQDFDSIVQLPAVQIPAARRTVQQAAFRLNGTAYIDTSIYNRLSDRSQSLLILHETLHSYLAMNLNMRKLNLRSLVNGFARVDSGAITSREQLYSVLESSQMGFVRSVEKLAPFRSELEILLADSADLQKAVLALNEPEKIFNHDFTSIIRYLAAWDRPIVQNAKAIVEGALIDILKSGDQTHAHRILNEQKYEQLNPAALALTVFKELSQSTQTIVLNSKYLNRVGLDGIRFLKQADILTSDSQSDGSLMLASPELQALSADPRLNMPQALSSLRPRGGYRESSRLPSEIQAMAAWIARLQNVKAYTALQSAFFENDVFYAAMGLKAVLQKAQAFTTPIERERALNIHVLEGMRNGLIKEFFKEIENQLSVESYSELKKMVHFERFN